MGFAQQRRSGPDVAIVRGRTIGADPERDDPSVIGGRLCRATGGRKRERLCHRVVGGQDDHDGIIAVALPREDGAGDDRRTRVAAVRFEQYVGGHSDLAQLFGDEETVLPIGDDDGPAEQGRVGYPQHRLLKCRARPQQPQKLFRPVLA